jgi:hypothetical protein
VHAAIRLLMAVSIALAPAVPAAANSTAGKWSETKGGGHSTLADGRLLVAGGHIAEDIGPRETNVFDPLSQTWAWADPNLSLMAGGRWYPSNVTLPTGKAMTLGGSQQMSVLSYGGLWSTGAADRDPRLHRLYLDATSTWPSPVTITPDPIHGQPAARQRHTLVDSPGIGATFLFAGRDSSGNAHNDLWYLRAHITNTGEDYFWTKRLDGYPTPPFPRSGHTAVFDKNDRMFVFGGRGATGFVLNDASRWQSPGQGSWTNFTALPSPPSPREGHAAIADLEGTRNRMLVFGGADENGTLASNAIWALDMSADPPGWSQPEVYGPVPPARTGHTLLFSPFEVYDSGYNPGNKHRAILFGGKGAGGQYLNDVWELWIDKATGELSWNPVTPAGEAPAGRAFHATVYDRFWERMLVTGGQTADDAWSAQAFALGGLDQTALGGWTEFAASPTHALAAHQSYTGPLIYSRMPERFDPATNVWSPLGEAPRYLGWYPFTFLLPSGNVFQAGPANNATAVLYEGLNPPRWGPVSNSLHDGGSAVMYRPGEILKTGAQHAHVGGNPTPTSERIRLLANDEPENPATPWALTDPMHFPRMEHNLTVLPNGKVIVSGGRDAASEPAVIGDYVLTPEIFDPAGVGTWSGWNTLAPSPIGRGYHSTALLLPDARLLTAGGNGEPVTPTDHSVIYCPPYLYDGSAAATRPEITACPATVSVAQTFDLDYSSDGTVTAVCLIRPGAVTHAFDQNQRHVPLDFTVTSPTRLSVTAPANTCIAPPGDYLLFIRKGEVPCRLARWVTLTAGAGEPSPPASVTDMWPEIIGSTEVWPVWTAPGDDGASGLPCSYDMRFAATPMTSDALFDAATRSLHQPITQPGGSSQSDAVTGLTPCAQNHLSLKARDDAGFWSPLGTSLAVTTTCGGGGGGYGARPAAAPRAGRQRTAAGVAASAGVDPGAGALAAEMRLVDGAPVWSVYRLGTMETQAGAAWDEATLVVQVRNRAGAWETVSTRRSATPAGPFGVGRLRSEGRVVFPGEFALGQVEDATAAAGTRYEVTSAQHSRLGPLTLSPGAVGSGPPDLAAGDTLTLSYARGGVSESPAKDWFLLVQADAFAGAASGQRSGVKNGAPLPAEFALGPNQPNPFRGVTVIPFALPVPAPVRLEVFDLLGRKVATLADAHFPAGDHTVAWDLRDLSGVHARPGVYLIRMEAGATFRARSKMSVLP